MLISVILAARTFLAIQNFCVSLCAIGVSFFLWTYSAELDAATKSEKGDNILEEFAEGESKITSDAEKSNVTGLEPQSPWFIIPLETAKMATIVGVIAFSSIARLASSGTVIILQKDWIVVISENDTDYLASTLIWN